MRALVLSVAFVLVAVHAQAQTAASSWAPWLGCWELSVDSERSTTARRATLGDRSTPSGERPRVCVTSTEGGGARFVTTLNGQTPVDYTTIPDGVERPLEDDDCRGTQRAEWSRDGLRVYSRADLTCDEDAGPRRISGLSLFAPNGTWLDIQAIDVAGRGTVRVRRYHRAIGEPGLAAATVSASVLTADDIADASAKVSPRALEAALVETDAGFDLSGRSVIELDEAGVADSVIDLMVALSYPEHFIVERTSRGGGGGGGFANDPFMLGWAFGYPVWDDDYYYSPYYYMPFGYSSYALRGYGDTYYTTVPVASAGPQPSGTGRAVDGLGYTRVRSREAATADSSPGARSSSIPDASGSSSGSSSSSGSTASSTGGYTGGTSSGDSGRTAQPR